MDQGAAALVAALHGPPDRYKRAEIDTIIKQREACTPHLLALVEQAAREPDPDFGSDFGDDFSLNYALVILAHLREPRAHDLIVRLARAPEAVLEALIGDMVSEGLAAIFFATAAGRTDGLREVLRERQASPYARVAAAEAMALFVHQELADRGEVLALLAEQLHEDAAEPDSYLWTGLTGVMLNLHAVEYEDLLLSTFDNDLIMDGFIRRHEITDGLAEDPTEKAARLDAKIEDLIPQDVHEWLEWWACFGPAPRVQAGSPRQEPVAGPPWNDKQRAKAKRKRKEQKKARKKQRKMRR